jgi:hypothetical protein
MVALSPANVLAASALALALVAIALRPAKPTPAPGVQPLEQTAHPDDTLDTLRRKVDGLQRAMVKLRVPARADESEALARRLAELEARLEGLASDHEERDPEPALSEDDRRLIERARTDVQIGALEEQFSAEPRNEAWARATEGSIKATLEAATGVAPRSVDCQSRLCRVELQHKDEQAEWLSLHKLLHVPQLGDTETFSERHEHADGSTTTLTFLSGGGSALPASPEL